MSNKLWYLLNTLVIFYTLPFESKIKSYWNDDSIKNKNAGNDENFWSNFLYFKNKIRQIFILTEWAFIEWFSLWLI